MSNSNESVVVVGAGPSGVFQALYLAKIKKKKVLLIEQQESIGGIF